MSFLCTGFTVRAKAARRHGTYITCRAVPTKKAARENPNTNTKKYIWTYVYKNDTFKGGVHILPRNKIPICTFFSLFFCLRMSTQKYLILGDEGPSSPSALYWAKMRSMLVFSKVFRTYFFQNFKLQ